MDYLVLSQRDLQQRKQRLRKLLKSISKIKEGPALEGHSSGSYYILGAHDGSPPKQMYEQWRFATISPNFRAQYYEKWATYKGENFYLESTYLHIYKTDRVSESEKKYLLLHCDPAWPVTENHAQYKRGPHLHVSVAEEPIPHSHIALCLVNLNEVLSSLDTLTNALGACTHMIREQFLDHSI